MADLVTVIIDGYKVSVPKGTLVIEAATQLGIDVPRFCYHPKLSAVGMCRMCLGEVGMPKMNPDRTPALNEDGTPQIAMMPKPQTLCTMQAAEGMVVNTQGEAVEKMRSGVMEFFLANHPLDCPICDKGGECMLQDQAMGYGRGQSRVQDMYHLRKDLDKNYPLSPLIALDRERCIQCGRCTRFCDEVAQDPVLELVARGSATMIDTLSDPAFDTKFSGNTIDICPVGALTSRAFRFRARVWELKNTPTISMADGCGTNIFVGQRNETFVRIIPRDNESINECWISDRDRFGLDWVDNEARLTQPYVRRDGKLSPATWDEALQLVADTLKKATNAGVVGGPKLTNEGATALAHLCATAGIQNVDSEWQPKLVTPGKPPVTLYEELEAADCIIVVGSNPNEELPILDLRLKKAAFQRKASLVTINAYKTSLDPLAKPALMINEGSEVALLNGLAKLVHQSWTDEPAKSEAMHAMGGEKLWLDSLVPYASGRVAEICGVSEDGLRAASTAIAASERLVLLIGENASPATLTALQNIAAMKGRSDYVVVLAHGPNTSGVKRAGLVPQGGMNGAQMLQAAADGKMDALYLAGTNPLNGAADYEVARRALQAVPFLAVQTLFMNELCEFAHVVLPAASYLESEGSTTNFAGRVQNIKPAFRPRERRDEDGNTLSACAPDWVIFTKVAQLLGDDAGVKAASGWTQKFKAMPTATSIAPQLQPVAYEASPVVQPDGTLRLLSGTLLYDGGESFAYCERLAQLVPEAFVYLNRADARRMKIETGALVELETAKGTVQVRAKVGRSVKEGTAWLPERCRQVRASQLRAAHAPFTALTVRKLEDAPKELLVVADTHAVGVGQGAPVITAD